MTSPPQGPSTVIRSAIASALDRKQPAFSGAVVLASVDGAVVVSEAVGRTIRWADDAFTDWDGTAADVTPETIFDLASITKLFTAAATLVALDERGLSADTLVADFLPEFLDGAAAGTTVRQLLSHTGGWASEWRGYHGDGEDLSRFRQLRPEVAPGVRHEYSCVGYIWAGLLAEAVSGEPLDVIVQRVLLDPLGMSTTMFRPAEELIPRIAATEFQQATLQQAAGVIHGLVHDETARALGGVAGNAGLFSTAEDLLRFAELIRHAGMRGDVRILPEWVVGAMTTDQVGDASRSEDRSYGQALGPRIDDRTLMGNLAGNGAVGHGGFTGTALITQPHGQISLVFLTNRVHPSRHWTDLRELREIVGDEVAKLQELQ